MWKVFQQYESQIITALDTSNSETNMSLTMPPHSWRHRHFIHCFSDYPLPDRAMSIGGTEYEHNGILQCLLIGDRESCLPQTAKWQGKGHMLALTKTRISRSLPTFMYRDRYSVKQRKERHPQLHEPDLHAAPNHYMKGLPATTLFSAEGQKKAPDPL